MKLIECIPNISEGQDPKIIDSVVNEVKSVDGVYLLDVSPGAATNRTVITFVGDLDTAPIAAFRLIKKAAELIDMRSHKGEHPRNGATDVCPFVPIGNTTMAECVALARKLGKRVGDELGIPVYLYENAATTPDRRMLATIRKGEYEELEKKLETKKWRPDFGPSTYTATTAKSGATQIGARQFLIAYNINLNTKNPKFARRIGLMIREQGGAVVRDENGKRLRDPDGKYLKHQKGLFENVNATGWLIEEYGAAQVTMNLTDFHVTPPHIVFDQVCALADEMGVRVTGSELVGLIPLEAMLAAGRHYLAKQKASTGVPESDLIDVAVASMGMSQISRFDPRKRIVEYCVEKERPLNSNTVKNFVDELSRNSPAPGGGSVAALAGALAAGLGGMVANLTIGKKGYAKVKEEMLAAAKESQCLKDQLLQAVDDDTLAFNRLFESFGRPKGPNRDAAVLKATKDATQVPLSVLEAIPKILNIADQVAKRGNKNSLSDAGVAVLSARTAAMGAYYNVLINLADITDEAYKSKVKNRADILIGNIESCCNDLNDEIVSRLRLPFK